MLITHDYIPPKEVSHYENSKHHRNTFVMFSEQVKSESASE